jgi:hypothetical protein
VDAKNIEEGDYTLLVKIVSFIGELNPAFAIIAR